MKRHSRTLFPFTGARRWAIVSCCAGLLSLSCGMLQAESKPLSVKVTPEGGGAPITITLTSDQEKTDEPFGAATLKVGSTRIEMPEDFQGFEAELKVYTVSSELKQPLVVASATGGSDFSIRYLFVLQHGALKQVGRLEGNGELKITGNGAAIHQSWMGFFTKTERYVFNKDYTLKLTPQEFYAVGAKGKVVKSFPVCQTRDPEAIFARTRPGSEFEVLLWVPTPGIDPNDEENFSMQKDWFLIRTESGFTAWTLGKNFQPEIVELPWAG